MKKLIPVLVLTSLMAFTTGCTNTSLKPMGKKVSNAVFEEKLYGTYNNFGALHNDFLHRVLEGGDDVEDVLNESATFEMVRKAKVSANYKLDNGVQVKEKATLYQTSSAQFDAVNNVSAYQTTRKNTSESNVEGLYSESRKEDMVFSENFAFDNETNTYWADSDSSMEEFAYEADNYQLFYNLRDIVSECYYTFMSNFEADPEVDDILGFDTYINGNTFTVVTKPNLELLAKGLDTTAKDIKVERIVQYTFEANSVSYASKQKSEIKSKKLKMNVFEKEVFKFEDVTLKTPNKNTYLFN